MAIQWGSWKYSGGNGMRVGISISWASVSHTSSSVKCAVKYYTQNQYRYADAQTLTYSGSITGHTDWSNQDNAGETHRWATKTYTYTYGSSEYGSSPGTRSFTAKLSGAYNGVTPSKTVSTAIPARPYGIPAAPSSVIATPEGDKWRLAFPSVSTAGRPASSRQVQIWVADTGEWRTLGTVAGTSWLTATAVENGRYQARARAHNTAGYSDWTTSSFWRTKPTAPANVTATKSGVGQATVTWTNRAPYATGIEVTHYADGVSQGVISTGLSGTATSFTATGLDTSKTHRFGVRAKTSEGYTFTSTETLSAVIQLDSPPYAPTGLTPNGGARDAATSISFGWVYNSADSSPQTSYELRYRPVGGTWVTVAGTGATTTHTLPAGTLTNGTSYEWQTRCKAQHPDWGTWSATAMLTASTPPAVTIQAPADAEVLALNQCELAWSYSDEEGEPQQLVEITLTQADATVFTAQISDPGQRDLTLPIVLENNTAYTVSMRVWDAAGLVSTPDAATFTTDFLPPPTPLVTATWLTDTAAVELQISNPIGVPAATHNLVERSLDEGATWVEFGTSPLNTSWVDPTPHLRDVTQYRVTAISELPSASTPVVVSVTGASQSAWINYGPGLEQTFEIPYNLVIPGDLTATSQLHEFLGRANLVPVYDLAMPHTRTVSVAGVSMPEITETVLAATLNGDIYYRDPSGRRMWATVTGASHNPSWWGSEVSLKLTEIDHP